MIAAAIYALCALAAGLCAWLLLRSWFATRYRLLLWSGLCFCGLTANNLLLMVDKIVLPQVDLLTLRLAVALLALLPLLYGLIFEA